MPLNVVARARREADDVHRIRSVGRSGPNGRHRIRTGGQAEADGAFPDLDSDSIERGIVQTVIEGQPEAVGGRCRQVTIRSGRPAPGVGSLGEWRDLEHDQPAAIAVRPAESLGHVEAFWTPGSNPGSGKVGGGHTGTRLSASCSTGAPVAFSSVRAM